MKVLGFPVALFAGNDDFADILVVEVADRALDQRAFFIDEARGRRGQRQRTDVLPQAHQIFEVALDLDLGAVGTGSAQDDAHTLRHIERAGNFLQTLAVRKVGDLAGNPAATRRVRHQDRIAAGEREIGGERRALVAAFFLGNLHQQDLPALDDFLDAVLLARTAVCLPIRNFLHGVFGADGFDDFLFLVMTIVIIVVIIAAAAATGIFRNRIGIDHGSHFAALRTVFSIAAIGGFDRFCCGLLAAARPLRLGLLGLFLRCDLDRLISRLDNLDNGFFRRDDLVVGIIAEIRTGFDRFDIVVATGFLGFRPQKGLAVGKRDLVIVRVDFRKGQKAVAVAAVIDESRLKRRFDAGDFREIDISANLFLVFGFEVEFFYATSANDNDARLFSVRRIDKHFLCHLSCAPRRERKTAGKIRPGGDFPCSWRLSPNVNVPAWLGRWGSGQTAPGTKSLRGLFASG